ncbi:MAG: sel1 repeat family protein [Verrucomicrobia bacterium]|nr:sel1 repeat family protein [Verrucomicrobiota bacterium]
MNPFEELRIRAESGDSSAQLALANAYYDSLVPGSTQAMALEWFRKAADRGLDEASYKLGLMFQLGMGVEKDCGEAIKWLRRAAERGHTAAGIQLGFLYLDGQDIAKNFAEAIRWFGKAAEQGSSPAQYNLGNLYTDPQGPNQDDAEAVKWFRLAAEQGHAAAQYSLGGMYAEGRGVERDDALALEWFRKAAAQGYEAAYVKLQRWPLATAHDLPREQDLEAVSKARHRFRVFGIQIVDARGSDLRLTVWLKRPFEEMVVSEIVGVNAVDYSIRPRNPLIIEGGPELEFYDEHPLLNSPHLQLVPGGDGEVFRPPLQLKLLILDQSHIIAERFQFLEDTK